MSGAFEEGFEEGCLQNMFKLVNVSIGNLVLYKVAIMFYIRIPDRGNKPLKATLLYFFLFELKTIAAITCE